MTEKIICKYCKTVINKTHITRHYNSNKCKDKQQFIDNNIEFIEFKCKYCDKLFNRKDMKDIHEKNVSCDAKIILLKSQQKKM